MRLLERALELVAPHECIKCGKEGKIVCPDCRDKIRVHKAPTCWRCNRAGNDWKTCKICRRVSSLAGVVVASHYEGAVKQLVTQLKFERMRAAAAPLAALITPLLSSDYDLITAAPTSPRRLRMRGYNQAELIARLVAQELALPYSPTLIKLSAHTQLGHNRRSRLSQAKGSFAVRRPQAIGRARILLIDDVLTTGATLDECAGQLKLAGAKQVWAAVAAKH